MIHRIATHKILPRRLKHFLRQPSSVLEDAAGVAVLFMLLFVGLTLSGNA